MAKREKMDSREVGLVLTEILLDAKDLHYGYWDDDLALTVGNARIAQQRYTDMLLSALPPLEDNTTMVKVLDIGCGGGHMMTQMLDRGYHVDGVSPSGGLSRRVKERMAPYDPARTRLFECRFQDFPMEQCRNQYDVALFSESFQYIRLKDIFGKLQRVVKPGGLVILCDFFKTEADGDGGFGDQSLKGGHRLRDFYDYLDTVPFDMVEDRDITAHMSPNLELVNDLLMKKIRPSGLLIGQYLKSRYPKTISCIKLLRPLYKKTLDKIQYKYFSGYRSKAVFERYKSYRFIRLRYSPVEQ